MIRLRKIFFGIAYAFIMLPMIALAQTGSGSGSGGGSGDGSGGGSGSGSGSSVELMNPLGDQTLIEFFNTILDVILIFAVPIIVFFIIYAGFQYVMARGKPDAISNANRALLYAVIGGVIILGAKLLLVVIGGTIDALSV